MAQRPAGRLGEGAGEGGASLRTEEARPAGAQEACPAGTEEARPTGAQEAHPAGTQEACPAGAQEARPAGAQEAHPAGTEEAQDMSLRPRPARMSQTPAARIPSFRNAWYRSPSISNPVAISSASFGENSSPSISRLQTR